MRIAAIRKHGRRPARPRWRWFVAQAGVGNEALYYGEVSDPREYLDLALDGTDGSQSTDPLVAVCAHGKHDQCCAVRGRSACKAIAANYPDFTWECSHLGGDRFAATMLLLPEGLCYGRVDSTDSADLVRLYLEGRLDNRFLRGRTSLPHAVQAAQYFAREANGDDHIASLAPLDVDHEEGTNSRNAQRRVGADRGLPQRRKVRAAAVAMSCARSRPGSDLHPGFDYIGVAVSRQRLYFDLDVDPARPGHRYGDRVVLGVPCQSSVRRSFVHKAVRMPGLICASTAWVSLQRAGFAALGGGGVHHGGLA